MVVTLLVLAFLGPATPPPGPCLVAEISAVGRGAHGANVVRHAAPHRLIRALDRLPEWEAAGSGRAASIVHLEAAPSVNIIPPRADALVELRQSPAVAPTALAELRSLLGDEVVVVVVDRPCSTPRER